MLSKNILRRFNSIDTRLMMALVSFHRAIPSIKRAKKFAYWAGYLSKSYLNSNFEGVLKSKAREDLYAIILIADRLASIPHRPDNRISIDCATKLVFEENRTRPIDDSHWLGICPQDRSDLNGVEYAIISRWLIRTFQELCQNSEKDSAKILFEADNILGYLLFFGLPKDALIDDSWEEMLAHYEASSEECE